MPVAPTSSRVLIVDDEHLIADTLALILRYRGFQVDIAYSGEQAIEKALEMRPDVLISDVVMGGMSGIDAAIEICRRSPGCLVILISGQASTADLLARAREQGHSFELLTKPVHPEVLLRRILSRA